MIDSHHWIKWIGMKRDQLWCKFIYIYIYIYIYVCVYISVFFIIIQTYLFPCSHTYAQPQFFKISILRKLAFHSPVWLVTFINVGKSIHRFPIVSHLIKILQNFWLTIVLTETTCGIMTMTHFRTLNSINLQFLPSYPD